MAFFTHFEFPFQLQLAFTIRHALIPSIQTSAVYKLFMFLLTDLFIAGYYSHPSKCSRHQACSSSCWK